MCSIINVDKQERNTCIMSNKKKFRDRMNNDKEFKLAHLYANHKKHKPKPNTPRYWELQHTKEKNIARYQIIEKETHEREDRLLNKRVAIHLKYNS